MTLMRTIDFDDADYLLARVEIVLPRPDFRLEDGTVMPGFDGCVTLYGRCMDDYKHFAPLMQELIAKVKPETTAHFTDEERKLYHPNGSAKKRGYKYIHHVHVPGVLTQELYEAIGPYVNPWERDLALRKLITTPASPDGAEG